MIMMNPMMEIQSCKSNDSQENPVRVPHTVSIVSRASCLIQYEPERVIDSSSPSMYKHPVLGTRNLPKLS